MLPVVIPNIDDVSTIFSLEFTMATLPALELSEIIINKFKLH